MNHHKCLIVAIVMILLSMTIGSSFSVKNQVGISSLPAKKELNYSIGGSGPQEEWNHTFGGVSLDIGTGVKPVVGGGYIIAGTKDAYGIL